MFKSIVEQLDFKDRKSLAILEAELERRKTYVWKTKSGDTIKVKDMSNEHTEFCKRMVRFKGKILLSGYDNEIYKILDGKFTKQSFKSPNAHSDSTETLWKNY